MAQAAERDSGAALRFTFADSAPADLTGTQRLAGVCNYFLGNDPARWRTGVPRFAAVAYEALYPGVELRAYEKNDHFEYDLVLAPGADLSRIEVRVEGATSLGVDEHGALIIETAAGLVRQPPPIAFATGDVGQTPAIPCEYRLRGPDRFGFWAPTAVPGSTLTIDPGLVYSTFLGGQSDETIEDVEVVDGLVFVAGMTRSIEFPTTVGAWDRTYNGGYYDGFACALDPRQPASEQLSWATFFGGRGGDLARGLAIDSNGVATIAGYTESPDFPTTPDAWNSAHNDPEFSDAFVTRLDTRRQGVAQLVYSTFLGGSYYDEASDLAVSLDGVVSLTGRTLSANFPTTAGAWDRSYNDGFGDAFVALLDPSRPSREQLLYASYLGGTYFELGVALTLDRESRPTVVGYTSSGDFPRTQDAWSSPSAGSGSFDAFVSVLDPSRTGRDSLIYSTRIHGWTGHDQAAAVAVDARGVITVAGTTEAVDFPTTPDAWDRTWRYLDISNAFVLRLDPSKFRLDQLIYSTLLGGDSGGEWIGGVHVDSAGVTTVAGWTAASDFPTTRGAWDREFNGAGVTIGDVFVARLDATLPPASQLIYSTFLGGAMDDAVKALAVDGAGAAVVVGVTRSSEFPTSSNAWDTTYNGGGFGDAFLTQFDMLPTGVERHGLSSAGCAGPLAIGVTTMPSLGEAGFKLTCTNAPPNGAGLLLLGPRVGATPIEILNIAIWVDPTGPWLLALPAVSNGRGAACFSLPLAGGEHLVGLRAAAQFLWRGPACPASSFSASNALLIVIQA